eukprot:jgi/Mesen1/6742/ME000344S06024
MKPPVWVPDAEALECCLCKIRFGLVTRRHHCRACGNVFCSACAAHKMRLPHLGIHTLERVCQPCHKENTLDEIWEAESFTARYYLRQHAGYTLVAPLFDSTRRVAREKSLFLATDSHGREYSLSLLARGPRCRVPYQSSESARGAFQRALCSLRHPYVWPIAEAEYLEDRDRAVVLSPFCRRGSLRDHMHKADPKGVYGEKYKRTAVPGLPVLEALLYLTGRGFRMAQLHSGNVLVDKKCCFLAGVLENELLGLAPDLELQAAALAESSEVYAFGRLLHELAMGVAMRSNQQPRFSDRTCPQPFAAILRSIFAAPPGVPPPSLQELIALPAFGAVKLVADVRFIRQTPLDAKCTRLLEQVKAAASSSPDRSESRQAEGAHNAETEDGTDGGASQHHLRATAGAGATFGATAGATAGLSAGAGFGAGAGAAVGADARGVHAAANGTRTSSDARRKGGRRRKQQSGHSLPQGTRRVDQATIYGEEGGHIHIPPGSPGSPSHRLSPIASPSSNDPDTPPRYSSPGSIRPSERALGTGGARQSAASSRREEEQAGHTGRAALLAAIRNHTSKLRSV